LVFSYKDEIVFVEVKTRKSADFLDAKTAVNHSKQERYRKIALYYGNGEEPNARFDVVEVYPDKIIHIANAF
jgi:Holliday junction resolvase-like predicted endonuclease